jgi:hypothetical protein
MAERMTHYCSACGKRYALTVKGVTLKDLQDLRLLTMYGKYWHFSCAKIIRLAHGGIDLAEDSKGQLIEVL